jgi:RNA polymerase sigma-70 factor (ECF subfamily)
VHSQLQAIYSSNADFVWRTLLRLGVAREDVGDAVQDVFLVAHQQLAHFEGRSALSTWLFTICRTVAAKRRRAYRRERENVADNSTDEIIDLRADVGRTAEHNQDLDLLESLLALLNTEQRNVFVLFELEKMTGEAISAVLDIPLGTVYSRLQLARNSFRQALLRHQSKTRLPSLSAGGNR